MDANQIKKLKALALAATPGPWQWWTSNSTLRLTGADGRDGGVLCGTAYGGMGNVSCREPNRAFIEASNPAAALELIAELEELRRERGYLTKGFGELTEQVMALTSEVERLRAAVGTRDALLRALNAVAIERGDKFGTCDCIDNRGSPYPSQHLADVLKEGTAIAAHTKAEKDNV